MVLMKLPYIQFNLFVSIILYECSGRRYRGYSPQAGEELSALLPSVLDKAFKGKL
jgi:hypothetical protein